MRPKGTPKELERRRLRAVALLDKGVSAVEVAKAVEATPGAVSQWKTRYQRAGPDALMAKPHPGPKAKLTAKQRKQLGRMLGQGARKHGYSTELWTLKRIGQLIGRQFGVAYEQSGVWRLLRAMLELSETRTSPPRTQRRSHRAVACPGVAADKKSAAVKATKAGA